jgi:outer membrane receptor for ferrienterochelin and colicins
VKWISATIWGILAVSVPLILPAAESNSGSEPNQETAIKLQPPGEVEEDNEKDSTTREEDKDSEEKLDVQTIKVHGKSDKQDGAFEKSATRKQEIDRETMERRNATDLSDLLNFEAGGVGATAGAGGTNETTIIDGLPPGQITVLRDGLPMRRATGTPQGPVTDLSSIPISPEQIEKIEIYRGLGPPGTGTDGGIVINIITKNPTKGTQYTVTGLSAQQPSSLWKQSVSANGTVGLGDNWIMRSGGQFRREDAVDVNGDSTYDLPRRRNYSGELEFTYLPSSNEYLTFRSSAARSRVDALGDADSPLYNRTETLNLHQSVLGRWMLDKRFRFDHKTDIGWSDHEFNKVVRRNDFERSKSDTQQLKGTQQFIGTYFFKDHDLAFELTADGNRIERTGETGSLPFEHRGQISSGVNETWYAAENLELSLRAIGNYHSDFGLDGVAQLGALWGLTDSLAVRGSVSRSRRVPTAEELFLFFDHSEIGYQIRGNPDLEPEILRSGRGGFTFMNESRTIGFEAQGFYHRIRDMIEPIATEDNAGSGIQQFTYANANEVHTAGLNASIRAKELFWDLGVNANYAWLPLSERVDGGAELNLRADHNGRLEISQLWLDESLEIWADAQGRSELTVPSGSPRAPAYLSFGTGVEYEFADKPTYSFQLDADNLFDQTNATWGPKPGLTIFATFKINYANQSGDDS